MIAVRDLRFGYQPDEPIIDGLDWTFPTSTVTAVTGTSGRGKSTLLYLLGLLLTCWSGRILLDGRDVAHLTDGQRSALRAEHIGFVFQDAALDTTRTVIDNICEPAVYLGIPRPDARQRAQQLMRRFDVNLRADHRPGEISGGQAQRVALCRALLVPPRVILADEPTGNLDAATATTVLTALTDAAHHDDAAVIIASHDPNVTDASDHVLHL